MPDGAGRAGDVAREAADIGALRDVRGEGDFTKPLAFYLVTPRAFISTSSPARARS